MPLRSRMRAAIAPAVLAAAALGALSCEGADAHVDGPKGASALDQFVVIGTGLSMGVQSRGVLYESQVEAWPAQLAHVAGVAFSMPLLRAPGCQPPLIAPLQLAVDLAGTSAAAIDTTCAGVLDTLTPPLGNLALPGATAYAALLTTPKIVLNSAVPFPAGDRARYPLVLGSTQSQVTALRIEGASFVAVELGMTEVLGAATSGLLVPATSYPQPAPYTFVPASVFAPAFLAVADSVKLTGARAVLFSVPRVTALYALRPASELWADRTALATFGITVGADCSTSANFVFTGSLIPQLAARYASSGAAQPLSCTDVPGAADAILTPSDITTLDQAVTQMNAQIQQVAQQNGWAFVDLTGVYPPPVASRTPYSSLDQLTCVYPYGASISLDGIFPNEAGQTAIAAAVAAAIDAKYGFTIGTSLQNPVGATAARRCP